MKKLLSITLATMIALVFLANTSQAQSNGMWNKFQHEVQKMFKYFGGNQGNGDCPGFIDEDGDGICDNCGSGDCDGSGDGNGHGDGTGTGGGAHGKGHGDGSGTGGGEHGPGDCDGSGRP